MESNGDGLIVRMVSTRCILPGNQNPDITTFGFAGFVSEDTEGNVDPSSSPSFRTGTLHTIVEDCPVCYEGDELGSTLPSVSLDTDPAKPNGVMAEF